MGAAIAANGIDRAELFLTSKLHPRDLGQASLFLAIRSEGRFSMASATNL